MWTRTTQVFKKLARNPKFLTSWMYRHIPTQFFFFFTYNPQSFQIHYIMLESQRKAHTEIILIINLFWPTQRWTISTLNTFLLVDFQPFSFIIISLVNKIIYRIQKNCKFWNTFRTDSNSRSYKSNCNFIIETAFSKFRKTAFSQ